MITGYEVQRGTYKKKARGVISPNETVFGTDNTNDIAILGKNCESPSACPPVRLFF
ncbi:MAG: hypothetical protein WCJ26_00785 [bacterium]